MFSFPFTPLVVVSTCMTRKQTQIHLEIAERERERIGWNLCASVRTGELIGV